MGRHRTNILEEMEQQARADDERRRLQKEQNKCHPCEFSTWVGTGYYCPFRKCMREDPFYIRWIERQKMRSVMWRGKTDGA